MAKKKLFGFGKTESAEITPRDDDLELVAVISAAVAALYDGTGITPKISRIRPAGAGTHPVWAMAGLLENTRAF